ncbi:hypothetical protein BDW74DRAFT_38968 [Aspergillus multicolor]|uniref:PX domain protein n=1 Tax=Aspergillus multicolor TaxID=41759 RepID=UPI003CCE3CFD
MDAPNDPNDPSPRFPPDDLQQRERSTCSKDTIDPKTLRSNINYDGTQLNKLVNSALQFLSTCRNGTLLLVLACLMAATYIILGRLGLLLIGTTLGVALHASWDGGSSNHFSDSQNLGRKQLSLSIVQKLLDWEKPKYIESGENRYDDEGTTKEGAPNTVNISSLGPVTATALHSIIDAAIRDYVNDWYEPIIPKESTFPTSCRGILTNFIASIASHLCRKRAVDTFLEFLINSSSIIIVFLSELCVAFETADPTVTAEDTVLQYLESNPDSSLSSLLAHQQQHQKLATVSDDILSRFLDSDAYNCIPVRTFLREVLTGIAFESTITSMSRPEVINSWIIYIFSESKSEIMSAIDAGVEGARNHGVATAEGSGKNSCHPSILTEKSVTESIAPDSGQAHSKVDRATEEAMLETKRLSAMIAAQKIPEYAEKAIQDEARRERNSEDDDKISVPTGAGSPLGEQRDMEATEQAEDGQGIGSSELGDSLTLSSLRPMEVSADSFVGSTDPSPTSSLYRALITVDDGCDSGDKAVLRSKPTSDYLIQIEPQSGRSGGWMVFRKYADFEAIHETLITIARLNQLLFGDSHPLIPPWKGRTRQTLGRDLERYIQEAVQLEPLAESVTMRRFLEKAGGLGAETADPSLKPGFLFPGQAAFENVGKGVLGVLTNAPKGVSGGGKAVLDGVTGVFGGSLNKKLPGGRGADGEDKRGRSVPQKDLPLWNEGSRQQTERLKVVNYTTSGKFSSQLLELSTTDGIVSHSDNASLTDPSDTPVPLPESGSNGANEAESRVSFNPALAIESKLMSIGFAEGENTNNNTLQGNRKFTESQARPKSQSSPITRDETRMAVELIFAVINELYSLSSAWNIRRTLLNAAKSYILRPGNPNLETIRSLLQESMIDNYTADDSLGTYLAKLRENVLPTEEELKAWPPSQSDAEKERQREAARRTLVQKGLPQAITSVMGAVATREALGRVFDSLQVDIVARGLVFAVTLQALRAIIL